LLQCPPSRIPDLKRLLLLKYPKIQELYQQLVRVGQWALGSLRRRCSRSEQFSFSMPVANSFPNP
jgi:hypothetical protein